MKKSLYIFGDSICYGQLVSPVKTWVAKLTSEIDKNSNKNFLVQNTGVNGNTTRQALERLHFDITSHKPNYVLVQFGMNDCNYWVTDNNMPRVSKEAFLSNIKEIVNKCLGSGVEHCFLNTNHLSNKGQFEHYKKISYDDSNKEYNDIIKKAFQDLSESTKRITLIDIEQEWVNYINSNKNINLEDLLLEDGIHLSIEGHNLYSLILIPKILKVVLK